MHGEADAEVAAVRAEVEVDAEAVWVVEEEGVLALDVQEAADPALDAQEAADLALAVRATDLALAVRVTDLAVM